MRLLLILALTGVIWAVDKPTPSKITEAQQVMYFQAKSDVLEATMAQTSAQARLDAVVKAMTAVCPLVLDAQQRPVCAVVSKTEEPKPVAH